MSARDVVLSRIRTALGPAPSAPPVPRAYRTGVDHPAGAPELLELFVDRLEDYRATVLRCPDDDAAIGAAVRAALTEHRARRVVVPPGLNDPWRPADALTDVATSATDLDRLDGVVTGCAVAVAETGTIVLDGSPVCGRRAITLVPDLHVCVVRGGQVVQSVPAALAQLDPVRALTFVSGPSATSDIELNRVEGVHGPRRLVVVLAASP